MLKDRLGFPINQSDIIAYGNMNIGLEICYVAAIDGGTIRVQRFNDNGTIRSNITELPHLNECIVLGADMIPDKYWKTINELDFQTVS